MGFLNLYTHDKRILLHESEFVLNHRFMPFAESAQQK